MLHRTHNLELAECQFGSNLGQCGQLVLAVMGSQCRHRGRLHPCSSPRLEIPFVDHHHLSISSIIPQCRRRDAGRTRKPFKISLVYQATSS